MLGRPPSLSSDHKPLQLRRDHAEASAEAGRALPAGRLAVPGATMELHHELPAVSAARKLVAITVTVAILIGLNQIVEYGFGDFQINPYYARIVNLIGINVTLAVSLNLINGLAGQFSIGHAGFLAVGGYTATYLTVYHGQQIASLVGSAITEGPGRSVVMLMTIFSPLSRKTI